MFLYFDNEGYVYGYGSDYEPGSYEILSIPTEVDQYLGAYKYNKDTNEFIPDENKKHYLDTVRMAEKNENQLLNWFSWYDQQCMQYQRAQRLGLEFDNDINELDMQARDNAAQIKIYREKMGEPYSPDKTY